MLATQSYLPLQSKSAPTCITLNPSSSSFVTFSLPDRQVRVFSLLSGKLLKKYDESLEAIQEMQQAGTAVAKLDDMEFGRRLAGERELELPGPDGKIPGKLINAIWDESGAFVIYPTLLGIKGKSLLPSFAIERTDAFKQSSIRSLIAWQGCWVKTRSSDSSISHCIKAPLRRRALSQWYVQCVMRDSVLLIHVLLQAMAASSNPILSEKGQRDPTLACTGFKRNRFYLFTKQEPEYAFSSCFRSVLC